jgi:hypothetical protein
MSPLRTTQREARDLSSLQALQAGIASPPWSQWALLTLIAVGGSCIYGASLAWVMPEWRPGGGALWLALSAGLGWCVFGPVLIAATRLRPFAATHACMVTMAWGEAVLVTGAAVNAAVALTGWTRGIAPVPLVVGTILCSNVVMAGVLAAQLRTLGVPAWKTLALWMVFLNGSGALFFRVLYGLLRSP